MTKTDEIMELVFDYGDSRQFESSEKWSVKSIKSAIEQLVNDRDKTAQVNIEWMERSVKDQVRIEELAADAARYRFALVAPDYAICVWDADDDGNEYYYALNQVQIDAAMKEKHCA